MKLLTKNTDYAVRALLRISLSGEEYVNSREISTAENIPLPYLRRILSELGRAGLVRTREGVKGGISLALPPEKISLVGLIEIFQEKVSLVECLFRKKICANVQTCPLRRRLKKIEKQVVDELEGITLASLIEDVKREE